MDSLVQAIIEFIRIRQLNFAIAALLTCGYLLYQYWGMLFKVRTEELDDCPHSLHKLGIPRSRCELETQSNKDTTAQSSKVKITDTFDCNRKDELSMLDLKKIFLDVGSRSRSRSSYREKTDMKYTRGRRAYGRCPDCSKCNLDCTK